MSNSYRKPIEGLTIDSPSSYDLDDAFWLENVENGYILHISITDVGEHIPLDSPLDKAA
jgi:exoribonuclease R